MKRRASTSFAEEGYVIINENGDIVADIIAGDLVNTQGWQKNIYINKKTEIIHTGSIKIDFARKKEENSLLQVKRDPNVVILGRATDFDTAGSGHLRQSTLCNKIAFKN